MKLQTIGDAITDPNSVDPTSDFLTLSPSDPSQIGSGLDFSSLSGPSDLSSGLALGTDTSGSGLFFGGIDLGNPNLITGGGTLIDPNSLLAGTGLSGTSTVPGAVASGGSSALPLGQVGGLAGSLVGFGTQLASILTGRPIGTTSSLLTGRPTIAASAVLPAQGQLVAGVNNSSLLIWGGLLAFAFFIVRDTGGRAPAPSRTYYRMKRRRA